MFLCSCLLSYKSEMCFFLFSVHPFSDAYHLGPTQYEHGTSNSCLLGLYRLFRQHSVEQLPPSWSSDYTPAIFFLLFF